MPIQTNKRPNVTSTRGNAGKSPGASVPAAISPSALSSASSARDGGVHSLVNVLYHALQDADSYDKYIDDARRRNDGELLLFLRDAKASAGERVARTKRLLAIRLEDYADDEEDPEGEEEDEEEEDDEDDEEEDEEEEEVDEDD